MKDKIEQLEVLLNKIIELIEQHKEVEQIDLNEYDTIYKNEPLILDGLEESLAAFREKIVAYKNDKSFYTNDIHDIKAILLNTLNHISSIEKKGVKEQKSESNNLIPNQDFINLLRTGILKSNQQIFGTYKKKTVIGHLTEDGFFELDIEGKKIQCPDFTVATYHAWDKFSPNDGWYIWSAIDSKTGKTYPLKYFRERLRIRSQV